MRTAAARTRPCTHHSFALHYAAFAGAARPGGGGGGALVRLWVRRYIRRRWLWRWASAQGAAASRREIAISEVAIWAASCRGRAEVITEPPRARRRWRGGRRRGLGFVRPARLCPDRHLGRARNLGFVRIARRSLGAWRPAGRLDFLRPRWRLNVRRRRRQRRRRGQSQGGAGGPAGSQRRRRGRRRRRHRRRRDCGWRRAGATLPYYLLTP